MNQIEANILEKANEQAIYNIFLLLSNKIKFVNNEDLSSLTTRLELNLKSSPDKWNDQEIHRLGILKNAINRNIAPANSKIIEHTRSENGLNACVFMSTDGAASVVFKGTGSGEWIDNGEGLSGIPEENTYITYGVGGRVIALETVFNDYATDQQVQALNWFSKIAAQNGWNTNTTITLSGHSKGGNKAQFIAINSPLVKACYSFDGQGFSPEAISAFKIRLSKDFDKRQRNIYSISTDNDYVNVLGKRLMDQNNIYFFKSNGGLHSMEAVLNKSGEINPQGNQGTLSKYIENISDKLMSLRPIVRQYATLGIMNIFQKHLGKGTPVNDDYVSPEKTIAGLSLGIAALLSQIK